MMPRVSTRAVVLVCALGVTLAAPRAHADPGDGALHVRRAWSLGFSLVGGLGMGLSEKLFKHELAPSSCRWCDGDELNGLDRGVRDAFLWHDTHAAGVLSNVSGFGAVPLAGFGLLALAGWRDQREGQIVDDELIVLESVVGASMLNQIVKFSVGRERPFVRALPPGEKGTTADPDDNNLSFYSGHTSFTFSVAVASGTVASLRGYRAAPWIWASGLTLAGATGYFRIAADKHYFTDVLTGAAVGSFVGFAVPYWLHRGKGGGAASESSAVTAGWGGGPIVSWSGTF
jgi:membrane-associated phospholipid phosphatase